MPDITQDVALGLEIVEGIIAAIKGDSDTKLQTAIDAGNAFLAKKGQPPADPPDDQA